MTLIDDSGGTTEAQDPWRSFAGWSRMTCHCFLPPIRIDLALLITGAKFEFQRDEVGLKVVAIF